MAGVPARIPLVFLPEPLEAAPVPLSAPQNDESRGQWSRLPSNIVKSRCGISRCSCSTRLRAECKLLTLISEGSVLGNVLNPAGLIYLRETQEWIDSRPGETALQRERILEIDTPVDVKPFAGGEKLRVTTAMVCTRAVSLALPPPYWARWPPISLFPPVYFPANWATTGAKARIYSARITR